jgi:hypothetical protein
VDFIFCCDQAKVNRSLVLRDGFTPKNATVVGFKTDQLSPGERHGDRQKNDFGQ